MTLEELNTHLDMVMQLHAAIETLQHMQDKLLGAQQFDGMPHGSGAYRKTENLSIILEMQMDDVDRLKKIVKKSENTIHLPIFFKLLCAHCRASKCKTIICC